MSDREPPPPTRTDLAESRTDLAEDRTMLANERTFAGWLRTALAAIGIGVALNALFQELNPPWVPRALATLFVLIGDFIVFHAQRQACRTSSRLTAHEVRRMERINFRLIAGAVIAGSGALVAGLWLLY